MPRRHVGRKSRVRRRARRRIRRGGKRTYNRKYDSLMYRGVGYPDEYFCKLYYEDLGQLSSASYSYYWKSSLYAPNKTGGHQPNYYDQFCSSSGPYLKYQVLAMHVDVMICNVSTNPTGFNILFTDTAPSGAIDYELSCEQKWSKQCVLSGKGGQDRYRIRKYMSAKKLHGQGNITAVDNQIAVYNADPVDMMYFGIVGNDLVSTMSLNVYLPIRITYYCRFFERTIPPSS